MLRVLGLSKDAQRGKVGCKLQTQWVVAQQAVVLLHVTKGVGEIKLLTRLHNKYHLVSGEGQTSGFTLTLTTYSYKTLLSSHKLRAYNLARTDTQVLG